MIRLRTAVVVAALMATAASGLSASPALAADQVAACDPTAAAGLTWSAPSFLAWGRQDRIGANVDDPGDGPGYAEDSAALSVDAGSASLASDPMDHDLEFVLKAPVPRQRRARRRDLEPGRRRRHRDLRASRPR